jgi:hypothetical protein
MQVTGGAAYSGPATPASSAGGGRVRQREPAQPDSASAASSTFPAIQRILG